LVRDAAKEHAVHTSVEHLDDQRIDSGGAPDPGQLAADLLTTSRLSLDDYLVFLEEHTYRGDRVRTVR
jgi:hypothetical protein